MYVAVRDSQLKFAPKSSSHLEALERIGVKAVELRVTPEMKTDFVISENGEPFDLAGDPSKLREALDARGVKVCALLMANRFESDEREQTDWLVRSIRAAQALGAAAVRLDVVAREMEPEPFFERAVGTIREALRLTEDSHMPLGVENHGKTSNRVEYLRELFDAVGSERFGLTLDTGNFYWYGYPLSRVYEIMEEFAPRVKHTHVKNINYPEETREKTRDPGWEYKTYVSPVPDGDIDHKRVAAILKAGGYEGALTLEDESYGKFGDETRTANLLRNVEHLKSVT